MDWLGSGSVSAREFASRIITEAIRRIKLEARNDPVFVPPADDLSVILAARQFVLPVVIPPPVPNDLGNVLANRIFNRAVSTSTAITSTDAGAVLAARAFGYHVPASWPSLYLLAPVVARGLTMLGSDSAVAISGRMSFTGNATGGGLAAGDVARSAVTGLTLVSGAGSSFDFSVYSPAGAVILSVPTGTVNVSAAGTLTVALNLTVSANGITVTGNSTITGTLGGVTTFTCTTVTATNLGGTLTTAAQANVTSLGTLTGLVLGGGVSPSFASAGANLTAGQCTLGVGGTVTVNTTAADSLANGKIIFFQRVTAAGTIGFATTYTTVAATSFTLLSDNPLDRSVYNFVILAVH